MIIKMSRARAVLVVLAAVALVLSACSRGGGETGNARGGSGLDASAQQAQISFGGATSSTGPADPVPGAKTGGTLNVLQYASFAHLDPAQIYANDQVMLAALIHRGLTTYKLDSNGKYTVIGDVATDSGTPSDAGKTWTYTLKDGITWEDGKPITSLDIRHSVERLFAPFVTSGPTYLQQWLADTTGADYRALLPDGPFKGRHLPDSILETPDDKTIIFHFKKPRLDLPYVLALAGYSAVPAAKDTKERYDRAPVVSGPYRIEDFKSGRSMTLVKNSHWDPKTDAARHQYVDRFDITFNIQGGHYTKRVISDHGDDATALSFTSSIDAMNIPTVVRNQALKKRTVSGYQPAVGQILFNMSKIKDKNVRLALAYAIPAKPTFAAMGASYGAEYAGGFLSPTVAGYRKSDFLGKVAHPEGEPAKARELLEKAGKLNTKITYAFPDGPQGREFSLAITDPLRKAGFVVQRKGIESGAYYDVVNKVDNDYDVYELAWGADWPSALSVIPPLFDGRTIADGGSNYSHTDDTRINSEIDRISKITDPVKAGDEWFKLNKYIATEVVPGVPTVFYKQFQIFGSKVGGAVYNNVYANIDPTKLYVKQ
ncbi:ABC transporter substrate-binding protein [Streptomyces sp. NPDC054841]